MFGIGMTEILIILLIGVLIFGARRLPEVGRGLGKAIQEFKKASRELQGPTETEDEGDKRPRVKEKK